MPGRVDGWMEDLFFSLVDLPLSERDLALEKMLAENPEVSARLSALLAADQSNRDGLLGFDPVAEDADDVVDDDPLQVGQYEIERLVGRGGMGAVYAALHPGTGRQCAVKLLHHGFATRQNLQRFYREARYLARLDHAGIARIYDAGSAEAVYASGQQIQRPFIAMEFVTGTDILAYVRASECTLAQCAELVGAAAEALQHAHECGIIHRDIKPANILVDEHGAVKVVDFGIARLAGSDDLTTSLTPGTAAYMSPEQMAGLRDRVDTRTDVYALGATLYALVSGNPPTLRMAPAQADALWRTGKPDRRLQAILNKAMAWAPEHRYTSAAQFAEELRAWIAGKPILARPERLDWLRRLRRNHPRLLYAVVGAGLIAGAVATQPEWRLRLRARFLPAPVHSLVLLNFTDNDDPVGHSALPAQFNGWVTHDLAAGGLLKPMPIPSSVGGILPQGSGTLLSDDEVAKVRKLGAGYALVGDYDVSGDQPWSTLKIQARLIDVTHQTTAQVVSVEGSVREAQAVLADLCLQLTETAGQREQLLRLGNAQHPQSDRLYADGIALFAAHDLIAARTALEEALNANYANIPARVALARVLDGLGYNELARKQAATAVDDAAGAAEQVDAQALAVELAGRTAEGLRLRESVARPSGQADSWMAQTSRVKDLMALDRRDDAAAELATDIAEAERSEPLRLHWMLLRASQLRLLKGRPGEYAEAKAALEEARRYGKTPMLADALITFSEASTFTGAQDESIAALKEAALLYAAAGDRQGRARVMFMLGQRFQIHGRNGDAISVLSDALKDVNGAGFPVVEQQIEQLLGQAYCRGYDPELSRQMLSRALVMSWNDPEQYATRQILQRLGITMTEAGNLPEARKLLQSTLPLKIERGDPGARTFNAMGEVELLAGNADAVLADAARAAELAPASEDVVTDALILRTRGLALRGDYSEVDSNFSKAVEIATRRGMLGSVAGYQMQWGELLLQNGSAQAAVPHLRVSEDLFRQIDRPAYQAEAASLLASALVKTGNVAAGNVALTRASAISNLYKFPHARVLFEMAQAQVAAAQGQRSEAKRMYEAAGKDASQLGFVPLAEAADRALQKLDQTGVEETARAEHAAH